MAARIVLDAQPVIALLAREPSGLLVRRELAKHRSGTAVICAVNWCEVIYFVRRTAGAHDAARLAGLLRSVPLGVVSADTEVAGHAAAIKAAFNLGLGDCFAAGLALALDAPLMTGDTDFRALESHGLRLAWVGG